MQTFKDTAIREMLRRRHAAVLPLSKDFEEKLFAAYEQRQQQMPTPHNHASRSYRKFILWLSVAAAAAVVLLLGIDLLTPTSTLEESTPGLISGGGDASASIALLPSEETEREALTAKPVPPSHAVRKKYIARHTENSLPVPETASADTSKANVPMEEPPVALHSVFTPVHTSSLSAKGEDIRKRMNEKFNECASIIAKVKEESV